MRYSDAVERLAERVVNVNNEVTTDGRGREVVQALPENFNFKEAYVYLMDFEDRLAQALRACVQEIIKDKLTVEVVPAVLRLVGGLLDNLSHMHETAAATADIDISSDTILDLCCAILCVVINVCMPGTGIHTVKALLHSAFNLAKKTPPSLSAVAVRACWFCV